MFLYFLHLIVSFKNILYEYDYLENFHYTKI